jgi:hypothetical protein
MTARQLTAADASQSLHAHAAAKGEEIRAKYGPHIGWTELLQILSDRAFVRYPCEVCFDSAPLLEDEIAHPSPQGERPEHGFIIHVHPYFAIRLPDAVALVVYQLVLVNYGEFASADDAEIFGAAVLGMSQNDYYRKICELADELQ